MNKKNKICNLCKIDKKLIKAHIIPQAFAKDVQNNFGGNTLMQLVEKGEDGYKKGPALDSVVRR